MTTILSRPEGVDPCPRDVPKVEGSDRSTAEAGRSPIPLDNDELKRIILDTFGETDVLHSHH